MSRPPALPASLHVIERGWLSSNSILCFDRSRAQIVDTGYVSQAEQTLALVNAALASQRSGRRAPPLARILNTHSHSDHMGGNAALAGAFACPVAIPAGIAPLIDAWDEDALLLAPTGQRGARFAHSEEIHPGTELELGGLRWQALAAPGHDMHALMFYCAREGVLISGDALWHDGFGVVFGELMSRPEALPATRATLDAIAALDLCAVIPGHGAPFADIGGALARAYRRLDSYEASPARLARNAIKALLTFNLLEHQRLRADSLPAYLDSLPFFANIVARLGLPADTAVADWLLEELQRARAIALRDGWIVPLMAA